MSYAFRKRESVPDGLRRIAQEQLNVAIGELHDERLDRDVAVHQARKRIKKTRAILRLARAELGAAFNVENRILRDAGQALSTARDAVVLLETFERVRLRVPQSANAEALDRTRVALESRRTTVAAGEALDGPVTAVIATLGDAHIRTHDWAIANGFVAIESGLRRVYRAGQATMHNAQACGSPESIHEWRKRVKDLWYATRLLKKSATRPMRALRKDLRDLSEVLGNMHDLDVFAATLADCSDLVDPAVADVLDAAVAQERGQLASAANALGSRIYAETPKAFARRIRVYWQAWRHPAKVTHGAIADR